MLSIVKKGNEPRKYFKVRVVFMIRAFVVSKTAKYR